MLILNNKDYLKNCPIKNLNFLLTNLVKIQINENINKNHLFYNPINHSLNILIIFQNKMF